MPRGLRLTLVGLVAGLSLGIAINAFKLYIANTLIELLQGEARGGCDCHLEYDSLTISLLRLEARARNARLIESGQEKLRFEKIVAGFELQSFKSHTFLVDVNLYDGYSIGVTPKSATYRFIDFMATPPPPERRRPDRWRTKLRTLKVERAQAIEDLGDTRVFMRGVSMSVDRKGEEDFAIIPRIDEITLRRGVGAAESKVTLGSLRASLFVKELFTAMSVLTLERNKSRISAKGTMGRDAPQVLDGSTEYLIDLEDLLHKKLLSGLINGSASIAGNLDNPYFSGTLTVPPTAPLKVNLASDPALSIESLETSWKLRGGIDSALTLAIPSLTAYGPGLAIASKEPLVLQPEKLAGSITFSLDSLTVGGITLNGVRGTLGLGGTLSAPQWSSAIDVRTLSTAGLSLNDLSLTIKPSSQDSLFVEGRYSQNQELITLRGDVFPGDAVRARKLQLRVLNVPLRIPGGSEFPLLNGSFDFDGPLTPDALNAKGEITISNKDQNIIKASGQLERGSASVQIVSANNRLTIDGQLDLLERQPSKIVYSADNFELHGLFPSVECVSTSFDGTYQFSPSAWRAGSGSFNFSKLDAGCDSYHLALSSPAKIVIRDGAMQIPALTFTGENSTVNVQGSFSIAKGFDLTSRGALDLITLASVFPVVDELQGKLQTELTIRGPVTSPQLRGSAHFQDALIASDAANISLHDFRGTLLFDQDKVTFQDFGGVLNDGDLRIEGIIDPFNLNQSTLKLSCNNLFFAPDERSSIVASADLSLASGEFGKPVVRGTVRLESAEFQQRINLQSMLKELTQLLFSAPTKFSSLGGKKLPDIALDLKVEAPQNLLVIMNWLNAELRASFQVVGMLSDPILIGQVETLSGWFELRDRRFEVTSGIARFRSGSLDPELEVFSEAPIRAITGETVTVYLQASGTLSAPRITLSSDRSYSQRELFNLLTTGGRVDEETLINRAGRSYSQFETPEEGDPILLDKILRGLTRIDSISIEPTLDPRTGVVGPSLVAKKRVFDKLSLVGESSFGSSASSARGKVILNVFPAANLVGSVETLSGQNQSALGLDLLYTILAEQSPFLSISTSGVDEIPRERLLAELRLGSESRIALEELDRLTAKIEDFYQSEGYFSARAHIECPVGDKWCHQLTITVQEGKQSTIEDLAIEGDELPTKETQKYVDSIEKGNGATRGFQKKVERQLVQLLRREGYLSARIDSDYLPTLSEQRKVLQLKVKSGSPLSFTFSGNKVFSAEDFLDTIQVFERRQPFGNNTINILLQNMDRLYREAGYLYATIQASRSADVTTGRVTYAISVNEERRVKVHGVSFEGNYALSGDQIAASLKAHYPKEASQILAPSYAVEENIALGAQLITELFQDSGFPDAQVAHRIDQENGSENVNIVYDVREGEGFQCSNLSIAGLPEEVGLPELPNPPYSVPKANKVIQSLVVALNDAGYFLPTVSTAVSDDGNEIAIEVVAGPLTRVGAVTIEGLQTISEDTVRQMLQLKTGEAWRMDLLEESHRQLQRSGLFSSVAIQPLDGELDSDVENVALKLTERPLTSLEVGGGLNSEYGFHAFSEALDRSFFKDGRTLSLRLDAYYDPTEGQISHGVASMGYAQNDLWDTGLTLNEDVRYQKFDLPTYEFDLDRLGRPHRLGPCRLDAFVAGQGHAHAPLAVHLRLAEQAQRGIRLGQGGAEVGEGHLL